MNKGVEMDRKEAWVAPEIKTLDVGETQFRSNRGNDAGNYIDCTRS